MRTGLLLLLLLGVGAVWAAGSSEVALPGAEYLLKARFQRAGVAYPPERLQLIALKENKRLEVWAWADRKWRHIHDYPVFAASGHAGPKLREGDKQVPEGFYRISALNPNSNFHLSMRLDYPNTFDWRHAAAEGRDRPGSDIYIHGSAFSVGCLAIGNQNIEELYTLVSRVGMENIQVLIAPYDFRVRGLSTMEPEPAWVGQLYGYLNLRLQQFPLKAKLYGCTVDCLVRQEWRNLTPR